MLSWFCCVGSLLVAFLFARRRTQLALWLSLFMQAPWAYMAWKAQLPGVIWCALVFAGIDVYGIWKGHTFERKPQP